MYICNTNNKIGMKIIKIHQSKYDPKTVANAQFGKSFTDYMFVCRCIDGNWQEPEIMPFGTNVGLSPAIMALNYGQACFEGMKAYKNDDDEVFLFRPEMNYERLNKSAVRLAMPEIPYEIFMDGLKTFIDLERQWIPTQFGKSIYIRPVYFATEEMFLARISNEYMFVIMASVANDYYSNPLNVKIAQKFTRAARGGVGYAKAAGNYGASFYPTKLAREEGYDQLIWTDGLEHKYFEESGTMNLFVRIKDTLFTPPTSDTILNGITRDSIIQLAQYNGIEVKQERIAVEDVYNAHKNGTLKEVFGAGTAVVINRFASIGYPQEKLQLTLLSDEESYAVKLKNQLLEIQSGRKEDIFNWRSKVEKDYATVIS